LNPKMKTPKTSLTVKLGCLSQINVLTLAAVLTGSVATSHAQSFWNGGTSDFNVGASWNPTGVPSGNAANDSGLGNVVLIQPGDPVWGHGDTLAGQTAGASGSYLQTGSTNNTGYPSGGSWMRLGIGSGGTVGYYTLSNGVVNVAGQTHLGEHGTGTLEVDGGTYNTGYNGNPGICAGDGDFGTSTGTLILTAGTINNINNETWFGEANSACTGYLMMSGGTINANNWFVFGRNGGVGFGTMTAGTINFTGGGQFLIGGGGIGSLAQSGGTLNVHNQYLVPQSNGSGSGKGTNILSGTAVVNLHDWIAVGRNSGYGELDISGSATITRDNNNDGGANFDIAGGGPGVINQNGGAVTNLAGQTWIGESSTATWNLNSGLANMGSVVICVKGSASGTLNLNGGLFAATGINSSSAGTSILNFNGGTLQASAANANFMSGLSQALMGPGGVVFDSQGYIITVPQEVDDNGGGSLTKIGSGTLNLTGPNTYVGSTIVNAGVLGTTTASAGGGSYSVASGATLDVQLASAGGRLTASGVTLAGTSSVQFDLGSFGNPTAPLLNVGGALTVNGPATINLTASTPLAVGQYPFIQYASETGSSSFVLGNLPPGDTGYLSNNVANSSMDIVITSVSAPRWNGTVNGNWDINTTANWVDIFTMASTTYQNGEPVILDDNATGTTVLNLVTTVNPSALTANNSVLPYTLTGTGKIAGPTGLLKEGTGTLAILNTGGNSYTGATTIAGGTLMVTNLANGGSPSAIGASSANSTNLVLAGGTLSYSGPAVSINRGYSVQATNSTIDTESNLTLSGLATVVANSDFIKTGPAQLTYATAGVNTLSGAGSSGYDVVAGTVAFTGPAGGQTNNVQGGFAVGGTNGVNAAVVLTNAILNISGGTFDLGDGGGQPATGSVTQNGGVVSSGNDQVWIGQNISGSATYNLNGGTFNVNNWLAIGREGGTGTLNVSGSAVLYDTGGGGNLDIGTSGGVGGVAGTGTLNQTGGAITNTASQTWLGEGSSGEAAAGTWNMSGGTAQLGELHIGVGGTGTSTLNISGSASITESYLLLANYDTNTTGNVNIGNALNPGGTVTVNADMNVGGQGFGTLNFVTNGGGKLTVTGTLYLSRFSQTADGTVNLNAGGTLVAAYVNNGWGFHNNYPSPTNNPNAFNFNGGTLKAYVGSTIFIQPYVNAVVQSGGAIIDDGGFNITVLAALVDGGGGGGLTKQGNGTLILAGTNTYTGTTLVSSGTLGCSVSIAGPVAVASGAAILGDTGTIGTFAINNTLTLAAGSTAYFKVTPASNDEIQGLTGVTYGGGLVVSNTSATPLTVGTVFKLFNSASPGSGNFSSVTLQPVGSATFNPVTGELTITSVAPPAFNSPVLSGGNLILTGTGGTPGAGYTLLTTTNLLSAWTTNIQSTFSGTGTFSNSIPVNGSQPAQFFRLRTP
jgi:fibronectin-binding autotransporter adhesin